MDSKLLESICKDIYQRFPEVNGVRPKVRKYETDSYLLIFQAKAQTSNGLSMQRTVRVVTDPSGKVKKVSTSR
ncbi:MAG: hypothetical protein HPY45_06565 [Anaerolineae bacterium]|nr:hypothetical protein [Anaerolineae bacterium]